MCQTMVRENKVRRLPDLLILFEDLVAGRKSLKTLASTLPLWPWGRSGPLFSATSLRAERSMSSKCATSYRFKSPTESTRGSSGISNPNGAWGDKYDHDSRHVPKCC
jgi:hypothetical protein